MIVDPHQHRSPVPATYEWISADLAALRRRFEPPDLERLPAAWGMAQMYGLSAPVAA